MRRDWVLAGAAALALGAVAGPLSAQGSAVMTHGSCATALAAAQVADPCEDGSAILFNPAAIAMQPSVIGAGWTGITTSGTFTYDFTGEVIDRGEATSSVPFGFATYNFGNGFAAGIGVFNLYGLRIDWPLEAEGRFVSYDTKLRNVYVQPTVAYQTGWLSFGAGLDVVRGAIEINQRLDLATTPLPAGLAPFPNATFGNVGVPLGTDFADVNLEGDGTGVGFHLGALMRVSDRISFGARYMSAVEVDYDGAADFERIETNAAVPSPAGGLLPLDPLLAGQFEAGGPLADQGVATGLTLPAQFTVGAAVRPIPQLQLLLDYQWTGWDRFDEAELDFDNTATVDRTLVLDYQDTDTYRFGAELWATERLPLRAGFIYNTAAQREFSVSPLLPEAERNYYTLGAGYRFGDALGIDVAYQFVDQADRRGRVRPRPPQLTAEQLQALNVGVFSADASVFNVTLFYRFGGR